MVNDLDDLFEPFKDWLKVGTNVESQDTVRNNLKLFKNETAWNEHIKRFEIALSKIAEEIREGTRKNYLISFNSASFDQHVFRNRKVRFPCDISFQNSVIPIHSDFSNLIVDGSASFQNAKFQRNAHFLGAKINGNLIFDFASVEGDVLFCSTANNILPELPKPSKISGLVRFSHLKLKGSMDFSDAEIDGHFVMHDAKIGGSVQFWKTNIRGEVNLERTKIREDFQFEHVLLNRCNENGLKPSFNAMGMVVDGAIAVKSNFYGDISLFRLLSNGSASFAGCTFRKVPNFIDAKFANPFELSQMDIPPPDMPNRTWWRLGKVSEIDDEAKFRKLKVMAMQVNDHEREGRFLADEFMAKRTSDKRSFVYLFVNWLYWFMSDFGQSFVRPLVGLFCSLLIFPVFYFVAVLWGQLRYPNWDELYLTLQLSMRNFLPFFGSLFRFSPQPEGHKSSFMTVYHDLVHKGLDADWLVAIGIIQNIIGAVLLFLFLLALRNKFRLK